jgi:hypothetical protein
LPARRIRECASELSGALLGRNLMWTARSRLLADRRTLTAGIDYEFSPVTYEQVVSAWREDSEFRSFFSNFLAEAPFRSFRWETPPVTTETISQPFEFVLLDSPGIGSRPDVEAFGEHFRKPGKESVVAFPNLGRDAIMVVPKPIGPLEAYGHLGAFVRKAPESQQEALWQLVGESMQQRISSNPVWLSTAGAGVSWLHVRLDDRPKYYGYSLYKDPS